MSVSSRKCVFEVREGGGKRETARRYRTLTLTLNPAVTLVTNSIPTRQLRVKQKPKKQSNSRLILSLIPKKTTIPKPSLLILRKTVVLSFIPTQTFDNEVAN